MAGLWRAPCLLMAELVWEGSTIGTKGAVHFLTSVCANSLGGERRNKDSSKGLFMNVFCLFVCCFGACVGLVFSLQACFTSSKLQSAVANSWVFLSGALRRVALTSGVRSCYDLIISDHMKKEVSIPRFYGEKEERRIWVTGVWRSTNHGKNKNNLWLFYSSYSDLLILNPDDDLKGTQFVSFEYLFIITVK